MPAASYYARMRLVLTAIIRPLPWLAWAFCACVLAASLDRVPDPPAVTPHAVKIQAAGTNVHQPSEIGSQSTTREICVRPAARPSPASDGAPENSLSASVAGLVQQAADPSPPASAL